MGEETQRILGTKPLDEESWKALPDLLLTLRIAMTNIAFYPVGSKQVIVSLETAYSHLAKTLERNKSLILAESEGRLLANGQPLKEEEAKRRAGVFLQSLIDCRIKSVTFKQGVDLDELRVFLKGLGEKKWMKEKGVVLADELEESKIYHIGLDEKVYVPIGEGDLVIEKAKDVLAKTGGRIEDIMRAIDEAAEMLGAVEDEASRDKIRDGIAKRMLEMDPASFADLIKRKDSGKLQAIKEQAVSSFSNEKVREIVAGLSQTYIKLKRSAPPGSPQALEMEGIKDAIRKTLELGGADAVSIEVYQQLMREGVLEEIVRWEDVKAEEDLLTRVEKLTHCAPTELVTAEAVGEIKRILTELKLREEHGAAERIIDTVGRGLSSPTADIRLKVASTLSSISPEIVSYGSRELDASLEEVLISSLDRETDPRVYRALAKQLAQLAKKFIRGIDFEGAKRAVSIFRRHKEEAGSGFAERSDIALEELMWIGDEETTKLLLAELGSEDRARKGAAHDIMLRLEEGITRHLVSAVKETAELPQRKFISSILREIGEEATARLVEALESDMSVASSIRLMEVLDGLEKPEIALEQLRRTLSHPHPQVRHEAIGTLKRLGGRDAGEIVLNALGDINFYVLRYAVQVIGDLAYREAAGRLVSLSKAKRGFSTEEKDAIIEEICLSLGKLRDESALPLLTAVARSRVVAGLFKRGYSKNVRVAAIRALGRFAADGARETLETLKKDRDPVIKNAAISASA